jgi:hypothetical protein
MAFIVPGGHEGLSRQVFTRFRSLVVKQAIDIVTPNAFDAWKRNFSSEEEQYLAAQMLSAAVIRTDRMKRSSYRQIVEVILPGLLRDAGLWSFNHVEEMEAKFQDGNAPNPVPIRFMPVDGKKLDARPGNSGDSVLREFGIQARMADRHFVRADTKQVWQRPPRLLVLLDDLLGTGCQFDKFAKAYELAKLPNTTQCVYVPLLATAQGINKIEQDHRQILVRPVETLHEGAAFFARSSSAPDIWARDGYNTVVDVRQFYHDLMKAKGVGPEGKHSMELTVLLPDRTPNNTLKAYWAECNQWTPLLRR